MAKKKRVAVLLVDGFEEMEAIVPIDLLRRAAIEVTVVGVKNRSVKSKQGVTIEAECTLKSSLEDLEDLDGLLLPGGLPGSILLGRSEDVVTLVKKIDAKQKLVAAICAAPSNVLWPSGILKGRPFTCYPGHEPAGAGSYCKNDPVVISDHVITSRGPGTAIPFALAIIEKLEGPTAAQNVREEILFDE